ncbi:MAG: CRISPR-associated protein Cas5 [Thermofilaceae archaeon]|uniref:CRISPR-associated protein Cas5 n=1 Tax=Thermofilum pendens TaxID=2269 RepID=A0A7C4H3B4_THEPE
MKALTFIVRFRTAQFKQHYQKLARRTYLIPPPSAVAGIFGAILGVPWNQLKEFCSKHGVRAGAELRSLEGYYVTISRIFKFDQERSSREGILRLLRDYWSGSSKAYYDMLGLRPLKESEELFRPEYKLAIAAKDGVVEEGLRRLRNLDFEYEIFGGNDYHFVEYVGDAQEAEFVRSAEGVGYCPAEHVLQIRAQGRRYEVVCNTELLVSRRSSLPLVVSAPVGPGLEYFTFVYRAVIVAKSEIDAVRDRESVIFVYDPSRYLVP